MQASDTNLRVRGLKPGRELLSVDDCPGGIFRHVANRVFVREQLIVSDVMKALVSRAARRTVHIAASNSDPTLWANGALETQLITRVFF